jgi:hypothetical protein
MNSSLPILNISSLVKLFNKIASLVALCLIENIQLISGNKRSLLKFILAISLDFWHLNVLNLLNNKRNEFLSLEKLLRTNHNQQFFLNGVLIDSS